MLLRIDPQSSEPIFEQVVFQVKAAIARGALAGGQKLPSVREVAKELTINPNTVARAYEALEAQGVIVKRQGSGCFVTDGASGLAAEPRRRKLDQLMHRAVTEAFHLGAGGEEIRAAVERHLGRQAAPERKSRTS